MSLLVQYTLKSADGHDAQVAAMKKLVADLVSEGVSGVDYTCFSTSDATRFVGILEFHDDAGKQAFLDSAAFATYREMVGPTFANAPETTEVSPIASTRA